MDGDENDILVTNTFILNPDLTTNIPQDANQQFRKYYESLQKKREDKSVLNLNNRVHNMILSEDSDDTFLTNTNNVNVKKNIDVQFTRTTTDIKTLVSIDSRDRDAVIYPKPNNFKIYLGKDFYNVRKVRLASIEFPNTDAVINNTNNNIYWRNQEDIDNDFTVSTNGVVSYPIYSCVLRIGSYIVSTLQTEIQTETNLIRREQGTSNGNSVLGAFHYFVVILDMDTDIVKFISLKLTQLKNNPFAVTENSGVVTVTTPTTVGLNTNDEIYIVGSNTTSGIDASILNGFQLITVVNSTTFTFQVNVNASQTVSGGGNLVNMGIQAPFQLLWGQEKNTVAQNIGFPLENSSQLIQTVVTSLENLYQMVINTSTTNGMSRSYTYIGQAITVGYYINDMFVSYQTYVIQDILDTYNILVQVTDSTIYSNLVNNMQATYIQFGNMNPLQVSTYYNYQQQTFIVTTSTYHGYTLSDINTTVKLYNTQDSTVPDDVSYDGTYTILEVPSATTLVLPGVLYHQNVHENSIYGNISAIKPLTTNIIYIQNILPNYLQISGLFYTKVTCVTPHNLLTGDQVVFNNVMATPTLVNSQTITSVLDIYSFLIQYNMTSVDPTNISNGTAFIGTGLISLYFPSHGFNQIAGITSGINGSLTIQTVVPHNFPLTAGTTTTSTVRLMQTNTTPSIDGGGYVVTYISPDTFSITRGPVAFPSVIATGSNAGSTTVTTGPSGTSTVITTSSGTTTVVSSYPTSINTTTTTSQNTVTSVSIPSVVTGIIGMSNNFYLYGVSSPTGAIGGISTTSLNGIQFNVREIIDSNNFTFVAPNVFATSNVTGGNNNVFISSYLHGYNGTQTNTKNDLLNRSINLEGENYAFLTCPQLDTMKNTGSVTNIFARVSLDQPPGYVCFNFLSEPKQYNDTPLNTLSELEFSVMNYNDTYYEFFDLDFSFVLEITEVVDTTNLFNHSSRRGIIDRSSAT